MCILHTTYLYDKHADKKIHVIVIKHSEKENYQDIKQKFFFE